jgi:branched-chain amino acid aminotransferase
MAEVYAADEAFITSSFKDIVPVVKVGEHTIGTGTPGPITKDLMGRMHKYIEAY